MDSIDIKRLRGILNAMAEKIITNRDHLNDVDAGIGDADHGTGMAQSFAKARDKLAASQENDTAAVLLKAFGSGIMGGGGGASGALFSGIYLEGAKAIAGKSELYPTDIAAWWRAGLEVVKSRGKATPGDKTMVDALEPAVKALEDNASRGLADQALAALEAARAGVEATKNMVAGQGRSRYAGERSLGQQDAGATSVALLFESLAENIK